MLSIDKRQIAYNRKMRTSPIKYIVIHDTGNKAKGSDSEAHFKYFNTGNRNSSADFFVDDTKILCVNDYTKYCTWHVGDGHGKYGITNQNSVGIEVCVNADGDYEKTVANAVELTKYLMKELNITTNNVVRHYDASRKNCPASMSSENWRRWKEFKTKIQEENMAEFKDIGGNFAEKDIKELCDMGIVSGVTETEFKPEDFATRAQISRIARNIIRYITGE